MNTIKTIQKKLSDLLNLTDLLLMILTFLPALIMFGISEDVSWLELGIVSIPLFLVQQTFRWGLLPLMGHWAFILFGFALLYFTQSTAWLFAFLCACLGAVCMGLSALGQNLRSLGAWIFLPSLYLACELYDTTHSRIQMNAFIETASKLPIALIGPMVIIVYRSLKDKKVKVTEHFLFGYSKKAFGNTDDYYRCTIVGALIAIFITSLGIKLLNLDHGQWVIWSSVSVITGEVMSMHRKFMHRTYGAIIGLVLGIIITTFLPQVTLVQYLIAVLIPITLGIKNYLVAFSCRCMLITIAVGSFSHSEITAGLRVFDIVVGGLVGLFCASLVVRYMGCSVIGSGPVKNLATCSNGPNAR